MAEASTLEGNDGEMEEQRRQRISVSEQMNKLQYTRMKSDSFTVDMERFSHLKNKDLALNSRISLQRSFSRKGSMKVAEKKMNANAESEKDSGVVATSSSPKAALLGATMPEKSMVVTVGTDQAMNPQVHHHITITTGHNATTSTNPTATAVLRSKLLSGKRFSFRRSTTINPRRILFFFATLSSMGTILLIYFTLSMGKLSGDDNPLD